MGAVIVAASFLSGVVLGPRWNVFILLPAAIAAAMGALVVGVRSDYQGWSLLLLVLLAGTAVQVGYIVGLIAAAKGTVARQAGRPKGRVEGLPAGLISTGSSVPLVGLRRSAIDSIAAASGKR